MKCEYYFQIDNTPEDWKITIASIHVDEKAFQWHQAMVLGDEYARWTWAEYAKALKNHSGSRYEAPMEDLMNLRQIGSSDEFDTIVCKVMFPEDYLVQTYTAGLNPEFVVPLKMFKLRTLSGARAIARTHEINRQETRLQTHGSESCSRTVQWARNEET